VRRRGLPLPLLALVGLAACHAGRPPLHPETPPGRWYVLAPGETLDEVAARAGVPVEDILEINGLERADIGPGRLIFVLEGQAAAAEPPPPAIAITDAGAGLRWPIDDARIAVASAFGPRAGRPHDGIDLPVPVGTPVRAAAAGQVIYAGDAIRGYGNLVVVQHGADLMTVYAHNSVLLVRAGDRVAVGDRLALSGQSGRATGPHLHFEVRQGQIPRDPMLYLPRRPTTASAGSAP
jgi:murein DD-endopeptidase MepM/ murein hydrolase activator NlpD